MITIPLLKKITELFLILFATAALVKTGVFRADYSKVLSRITLYFVTPCVIFNSFQTRLTAEVQQGLVFAGGLAIAFQLLFFLVTAVLRRAWKASEVERASISFTNAGNLVIPLVAYALGQEWVIYVSAYILVFNVTFWTIGLRMFDSEGAFRIRMITGMVVGSMKLRDMVANRRIFGVLFFRMILCSGLAVLLSVVVCRLGGNAMGKAFVIIPLLSAIAPSASGINQLAILYNKDAQYASAINVLTTLSCVVTIPMWIWLFNQLAG